MLGHPATGRPHRAERVGFVDHQHRAMTFFDFDEFWHIAEVAVHAVHALDRHQHAAVPVPDLGQRSVERFVVVVWKRTPLCTGEQRTLHDAVVGQRIVDDQIFRADQMADRRFVGRVSADHQDRILHPDPTGNAFFQLTVDRFLARHQSAGRHAGAVFLDRIGGRPRDRRVTGQTQIVVRRKRDQLLAVDHRFVVDDRLVHREIGVRHTGHQHLLHRRF